MTYLRMRLIRWLAGDMSIGLNFAVRDGGIVFGPRGMFINVHVIGPAEAAFTQTMEKQP
jgi:hypothetical protein